MSRLEVSLLGGFSANLDGEPVARFEAESARALFVYLALHPGQTFSRDFLAELLWPAQSPESVLANLRTALHRLGRVLHNREVLPPFLEITRASVRFNPNSDYWVDVNAVNQLIEFSHTHSHRRVTACPTCLSYLEHAVALYQGDLLKGVRMDSQRYEEWLSLQRNRLHLSMMDVLRNLAIYYEQRRDFARAEEFLRRHLELEPWREEIHRRLIRLLLLRGQRSAAMAQYEICRRAMGHSFGVAPDPETRLLFDRIVSQKYAVEDLVAAPPAQNLPAPQALLVGRERESAQLLDWLVDPVSRVVVLWGPGGVGKTRLALEVAWELSGSFDHGIWWTSLGDAAEPADRSALPGEEQQRGVERLMLSIASAMKILPLGSGGLEKQILDYLRTKELLLILDSFERMDDFEVKSFLERILTEAPGVLLLITSRHVLNLRAERVLRLGGLSGKVSVELFLERAQRVHFDFNPDERMLEDIRQLCLLLDGNPLGIEIASAWISRLTPEQIHQAVETNQQLLSYSSWDNEDRHRSLRALYESSWELLNADQRSSLARLSVFYDGFSRQAAETAADVSGQMLDALIDRSLLRQAPSGRLEMQSMLRQFAAHQLAVLSSDHQIETVSETDRQGAGLGGGNLEDQVRERHSQYYLEYVCRREENLLSYRHQIAQQEIHLEWANIRAAWFTAFQTGQLDKVDASLKGIFLYWVLTGITGEAIEWFKAGYNSLENSSPQTPSTDGKVLQARLLAHLAGLFSLKGSIELAREAASMAVEQALGIGDENLITEAYFFSGLALFYCRQNADAFEQLSLALNSARANGAVALEADVLYLMGRLHMELAKLPQAVARLEQACEMYRKQNNPRGQGNALNHLGKIHMDWQDTGQARLYFEEALNLSREMGLRSGEAAALANLGMIYAWMHEASKSRALLEQALFQFDQVGDRYGQAFVMRSIAYTSLFLGDFEKNLPGCEESLMLCQELQDLPGQSSAFAVLSMMYAGLSRFERARAASLSSLEIARRLGSHAQQATALLALGGALTGLGEFEAARPTYQEALELHRGLGRVSGVLDALSGLIQLYVASGEPGATLDLVAEVLQDPSAVNLLLDPARANLACYLALDAAGDERAPLILEKAFRQLQTWASRIREPDLQASFWMNVPAHREILSLAVERLNLPGGWTDPGGG